MTEGSSIMMIEHLKERGMVKEIRIVINQVDAFIELHGHHEKPVVIGKLLQSAIESYREEMTQLNRDMQYMTWGQLVQAVAKCWYENS
jgi:hypothetical protein